MSETKTRYSERELIERCKKDPKVFQVIYEQHFVAIFNFLFKRLHDKDLAADLTQQVFFNALTHIKSYQHKGIPFVSYLYRIAINESNQYFRDRNKVRHLPLSEGFYEMLEEEFVWDREEAMQRLSSLQKAMGALNAEQLTLIELRFFEKRSFLEIANILSITENHARVKTHRVLKELKKSMGNEK